MSKLNFEGQEIDIPGIALGQVVPDVVHLIQLAEAKEKRAERKAKLYFWFGVFFTLLGTALGWLLGKYV